MRVRSFTVLWATLLLSSPVLAGSDETEELVYPCRSGVVPDRVVVWIKTPKQHDMESLWNCAGISPELESVAWREQRRSNLESWTTCSEECNAERDDIDIDGDGTPEALVKIFENWGFTRYLVFRGRGDSWSLAGHADQEFARFVMPQHRVVQGANKRWLVINVQGVSGTGVSLYYDRWYELGKRGLTEVLDIPAKGHNAMYPTKSERTFSTEIVSIDDRPGGLSTIRVEFTVHWSVPGPMDMTTSQAPIPDGMTWTREQVGVFTQSGNAEFHLDSSHSTVTEDEIMKVYYFDELTPDEILHYNIAEIERFAKSGSEAEKAALGPFLERCSDTPERHRIRDAFRPAVLPTPATRPLAE